MFKKIVSEIRIVGLFDWLWFNFVIHRNEFHPSLQMIQTILSIHFGKYHILIEKENKNLLAKRMRAHKIDSKLDEGFKS
jgi:hypothetical protein